MRFETEGKDLYKNYNYWSVLTEKWLQKIEPRIYWINCMAYFMTFYGVFCHFWALKTVVIHFHCMEKGILCFRPFVKKKKKMAALNDMGEYLMTDFSLLGKLSLSTSKMYI